MAKMSEVTSDARRKRVNRLKKLIILLLVTVIVVPIIMCVVLFVRMGMLEKQLEQMHYQIEQIALEQSRQKEAYEDVTVKPGTEENVQTNEDLQTEKTADSKGQEGAAQTGDMKQTVLAQTNLVAKTPTADTPYNPEQDDTIRKVYLTFDDGPSANTNAILDVLAQYNVKATFFVVGKEGEEDKAAMRRIVEEGHTIGMHSYSHKYEEIYGSQEAFAADFLKLRQHIYDVTGVQCVYFRFPGGSSNTVSSTDIHELILWVKEQGAEYYDWNASGNDAGLVELNAEEIKENCMRDIARYKTSMVLLHDAKDKPATVEALPKLLEEIQAMENTVILPITESTKPIQHITMKETEE